MITGRKIVAILAECPLDPSGATECKKCKYYKGITFDMYNAKIRCEFKKKEQK